MTWATFDIALRWVCAACLLVNFGYMAWWVRLVRQQMKLNALLQDLCMRAFSMQHAAIWQPWAKANRQVIEVRIRTRPEDEDEEREARG